MGLDQYLYRCNCKYIPEFPKHGEDTFIDWVDGMKVYNELLDAVICEAKAHGKEIWYGRKACIADNILTDAGEQTAVSHDEYNSKKKINSKILYYLNRDDLVHIENTIVRKLQHFPIFSQVFNNKKKLTADDIMKLFTCNHILEPIAYNQNDSEECIITSHILIRLSSIKSNYRNVDFTEFVDKLDEYPEYTDLLMFIHMNDTENKLTRLEHAMFNSIGHNEQTEYLYDIQWEYDQLIRLFIIIHRELTNKYTKQLEWYYYRSY